MVLDSYLDELEKDVLKRMKKKELSFKQKIKYDWDFPMEILIHKNKKTGLFEVRMDSSGLMEECHIVADRFSDPLVAIKGIFEKVEF